MFKSTSAYGFFFSFAFFFYSKRRISACAVEGALMEFMKAVVIN